MANAAPERIAGGAGGRTAAGGGLGQLAWGQLAWGRLAWAAAGAVLTACSGTAPPLPPPPARIDVAMEDYRFVHPPTIGAGRVVIELRNLGSVTHQMTLVVLPPDFPPIDEQLRSENRRGTTPVVDLIREPGRTARFAVDLAPGRYAFICFRRDADGVAHYLKGMNSEVRVG